MSLDLVRQALAFVDQEGSCDSVSKQKKHGVSVNRHQRARGQELHPYKHKNRKQNKEVSKPKEKVAEENIQKLLALSKPTTNTKIAKKIIERSVKGTPIADKIEIKTEEQKSILFADEEPNLYNNN